MTYKKYTFSVFSYVILLASIQIIHLISEIYARSNQKLEMGKQKLIWFKEKSP